MSRTAESNIIMFTIFIVLVIIVSVVIVSSTRSAWVIVYVLFSVLIIIFVIRLDVSYILYFLIIWLPIQSFVLTLIWQYLGVPIFYVRSLIAFKEAIILCLLGYILITKKIRDLTRIEIFAFGYFLFVTLYLFMPKYILPTKGEFLPNLASYRTMIAPILLYSLGRFIPITRFKIKKLLKAWLFMALLISLFGLAERFLLPISFWSRTVDMVGFKVKVQGDRTVESIGVKSLALLRTTSSGIPIRRLKSTFGHSCGAGYYLTIPIAFLFILTLMGRRQHSHKCSQVALLMLFLFALGLNLTRGAWLALVLGASVYFWYRKQYSRGFLFVTVIGIFLFLTPYTRTMFIDADAPTHVQEVSFRLLSGLSVFVQNPLGIGLAHGIQIGWHTPARSLVQIGESGLFMVAVKTGILGLFLFLGFIISIICYIWKNIKMFNDDSVEKALVMAICFVTIGYLIVSLFAGVFFGYTVIGTFLIFLGITIRLIVMKRKHIAEH